MTWVWVLVIVVSVAVIVLNLQTIRYNRQATRNWEIAERNWKIAETHSNASTWYLTKKPGDPKPDYVLESERLRARK